jgi:hypothetical protein
MHFSKPPLGTPLDWGNPLNDETAMALAMNEGHGDKVQDISMNGNHGTLNNFAFPPTVNSGWNPGQTGVGLRFDGGGDTIECENRASLGAINEFTISIILNMFDDSHDGFINIVDKGTNYKIVWRSADNIIYLQWTDNTDTIRYFLSSTSFDLSVNYKIAFVMRFGATSHLYIDGVSDSTYNNTEINKGENANNLLIGDEINGIIDQPRIQSRAWSAKEVRDYAINPWQVYLDE